MKFNYWQSFESNCSYHIYNRAVGQESLFKNSNEYEDFLKKYQKYLHPYFDTYAYCLMPNHFHFIVKVKEIEEIKSVIQNEQTNMSAKFLKGKRSTNQLIGDQLRRMISSISIKHNHQYNRRGPLFSPRVKRVFISNDDQLRYLIAYVHHNPIHHSYSDEFEDWDYSSFKALHSTKETLLARGDVLNLFGDVDFSQFH